MTRNAVPILIFFAVVFAIVAGWALFNRAESARYDAARRVLALPSELRLGMSVRHQRGPIVEETWQLDNRSGVSTAVYRIVGRSGETIKLTSPPQQTTDVSFLFGQAVNDGIWELPSRPPRGDRSVTYVLDVYELTGGKHGAHHFELTDPHYWATTGGHQFKIHLDRNKPVPDILTLSSTVAVEPRYERLVADFEKFGSPEFLRKVAQSRARIVRTASS